MIKGITIDELKERIDADESFILINCAENVSVCSMDAVKGTYCIPRKYLLGQVGALFSKAVRIILYCVAPECAEKSARELHEHGYTNVEYVMGNLLQWKEKGYPTEQLWPAYDWTGG
jgi:rhodanese-related sulfurtransferase